MNKTTVIQEIFSGIQGEGVLVGYRQIFLRFHGCTLACAFCDTPASREAAPPEMCQVETHAASRKLEFIPNPVNVGQLISSIKKLDAGYKHHSISLTGGEPLLQAEFIDELLQPLHIKGHRSYLETNGVLPEAFESLSLVPHYIALDIKLPSVAGIRPQWEKHRAFLDSAVRRLSEKGDKSTLQERLQIKIVFAEDSFTDIEYAAALIADCSPNIVSVLQPVTKCANGPAAPGAKTVLEAQRLAACKLTDVRVIPQTQIMLGQW